MNIRQSLLVLCLSIAQLIVGGCTQNCPESEPGVKETRIAVGKYARVWAFTLSDDDGAVVVGSSVSRPGVDTDLAIDAFVVKAGASGQRQWTRTWDWGDEDEWTSIAPSGDGGYYLAGITGSSVIFPGYLLNRTDMILAKIDGDGQEIWSKVLRGAQPVSVWSLSVSPDESFAVSGFERGNAILAKFDPDGNELWRREFEQSIALSSIVAPDGGYVFCGQSQDGYLCVVKTDAEGVSEWEFDGRDTPALRSRMASAEEVIEIRGGGYAVVATDLDGASGEYRAYVVRLDSAGAFQWDAYGPGAPYAYAFGLREAPNGSLVAGGYAYSKAPIIEQFSVCERFYAVRFSESGAVQWSARLGDFDARAYSIQLNSAGQAVFAGTPSDGGDVIYTLTTDAGG